MATGESSVSLLLIHIKSNLYHPSRKDSRKRVLLTITSCPYHKIIGKIAVFIGYSLCFGFYVYYLS